MLGHAPLGRYALGETATVLASVVAATGAFVLSGQAALSQQTRKAAVGAFAVTGQAATRTITFPARRGAFTISGTAALERGLLLTASPSVLSTREQPMFVPLGYLALGQSDANTDQVTTFLLTGQNVEFARAKPIYAETGIFTFTGIDAGLISTVYPTKIRSFPRVGSGPRSRSAGGGPIARASTGTGSRARAFGG